MGTMTATGPDPTLPAVPLVLDVDGTLLRTDLLYESFWAAFGRDPATSLRAVVAAWRRPADLKRRLAGIATPDMALLPVRAEVLDLAAQARRAGREVHLVSGSDQDLVDRLADRLGLPGPHFGSAPGRNLTAAVKAGFLADRFGIGGYDYAGNAGADLAAWQGARAIIAVAPGAALARRIAALGKPVHLIGDRWRRRALLHEMRPHQWVKNLLLFLPLLATHNFAPMPLLAVAVAAVAFSLGASSTYILNDLLDLEADRGHPEKRLRPIAAGALPIPVAMAASAGLGVLAVVLAGVAGAQVAGLTILYMAGSLSYSLWLKRRRWIDVLALALLFLLRVAAGAAAAQVQVPGLLVGFGFTVFFVLACVKRLTALSRMPRLDHLPGRGYTHGDFRPLMRAALASVPLAGLLYLAYVWGPHAAGLYSRRIAASLVVVPVVLWLLRMILLGAAGREDYDPVRFVLHDRAGLVLAGLGVLLLVLAA